MYQITKNMDRGGSDKPDGSTRTAAATAPSAPATAPPTLPMKGITTPLDMDILCGRGGTAFRHRGNQIYRDLVNRNKGFYSTCAKPEKPKISRSIVAAIRERNGRFLEKDNAANTWYDIGDKKAIEKTSQALREGQAKRRQQIFEGETTAAKTPPPSAKPVAKMSPKGLAPSVYVPPAAAAGSSPKVHYPPQTHQPPPQPVPLVAQQSQDSLLRVIDDEVLQHLDSMKSLTLQDDNNNNNNPQALMPTLEGRGSVPQQLGMNHKQKSDFSLMSDFSAFGGGTGQSTRTNLSTMSMGTARSPTSNNNNAQTQLEDGMPAIYMVDSSATLLSNISGMSGTTSKKQQSQQQQQQQQHWTAGVASVNDTQLPVVMESSSSGHHSSSGEITVQRPDASSAATTNFDGAMLTDDFYQQAKEGMMKSSSIGSGGSNAKDHSSNPMPPPPAVTFQQKQQKAPSANSLLQNSVMESSLSLQSNMSAITMTTLTTATTGEHSGTASPSQGQQQQQQQQPWRRMPQSSPSAGAAGRQEDIAEEVGDEDEAVLDDNDEYDATSYFSLTDTIGPEYSANSVMSGLSKMSIGDTSLEDASKLFPL